MFWKQNRLLRDHLMSSYIYTRIILCSYIWANRLADFVRSWLINIGLVSYGESQMDFHLARIRV